MSVISQDWARQRLGAGNIHLVSLLLPRSILMVLCQQWSSLRTCCHAMGWGLAYPTAPQHGPFPEPAPFSVSGICLFLRFSFSVAFSVYSFQRPHPVTCLALFILPSQCECILPPSPFPLLRLSLLTAVCLVSVETDTRNLPLC